MTEHVDERPAVAATRLGRDEEHRRWLTTVATTIEAPPSTPFSEVAATAVVLALVLAAAALAG